MSAAPLRHRWERVVREARLPTSAALVGLVLATYGNGDGTSIHPGEQRVADGLGVSRSTVARAMRVLREGGYVERVREGNARRGQADEYRLTLPRGHVATKVDHVSSPWDHVSTEADHVSPMHGSRGVDDSPQSQYRVIYTDSSTPESSTPAHVDDGEDESRWSPPPTAEALSSLAARHEARVARKQAASEREPYRPRYTR